MVDGARDHVASGRWPRASLLTTLGFRAAPRQMTLTLCLALLGAIASLGYPVVFKLLIDGLVGGELGRIAWAAGAVGLLYGLMWGSGVLLTIEGVGLTDRVGFYLSCRFARALGKAPGIEHLDRPEILAELELIDQNRRQLASGPSQLLIFLQVVIRAAGIVVILTFVNPVLFLLALLSVPPVLAARSAARRLRLAEEATVEDLRSTTDMFALLTATEPAKEIRICGSQDELEARHDIAAERVQAVATRTAWRNVVSSVLAWGIHGIGFGLALLYMTELVRRGDAAVADLLLVVVLVRMVQQQVTRISELLGRLLESNVLAERLLRLEDRFEHIARTTRRPAPSRLIQGIKLSGVGFEYPGTSSTVLTDIDLEIPRGTTVALVGDNGAGKTTLVSLLTKMYVPSHGQITVDGVDLADISAADWQSQVAVAFQDFHRFELVAREAVGIGDLQRIGDPEAVRTALERAGASDLTESLERGLETNLGRSFVDGVDLSGGQWKKIAVARAMMRDHPLLLVLDEPTASLDALAEQALFERYAAASRRGEARSRAITLLVSHRFWTVKTADLIVVLADGRVAELGDHRSLVRGGGLYQELYELQASGYTTTIK